MNGALLRTWVILTAVLSAAAVANAAPLGTAFTYQGQLKENGSPHPGPSALMIFDLYDDPSAGTLLGTVGPVAVTITDGLFTQQLDFGAGAFDGNARWLEITVEGISLSPRQEITVAPYALRAYEGVGPPNAIEVDPVTGNVGIGTTPSGDKLDVLGNIKASGSIDADGNLNCAGSIVLTGTGNETIMSFGDLSVYAGAQRAMRIEANGTSSPNIIGGYSQNSVEPGGIGAAIGGGGASANENNVFDDYGTIGGGKNNAAGSDDADPTTALYATVGGGDWNTASGYNAVVPGGHANEANGNNSFAAGNWARADHNGTFVWSSTQTVPFFGSSGDNQFLINAPGGVGIGTNDLTAGYAMNVAGPVNATDLLINGVSVGGGPGGIGGGGTANYLAKFTGPIVIGDSIIYETGGNVGIGTTGVNSRLHVNGDGVNPSLRVQVNGSSKLIVASNGGVSIGAYENNPPASGLYVSGSAGIGTTSPGSHRLSVLSSNGGSGGATVFAKNTNTTNGIAMFLDNQSTDVTLLVANTSAVANGNLIRCDSWVGGWHPVFSVGGEGRVTCSVLEITGADLAEKFPVSEEVKPGMVMEIDPDHPGQLCLARGAYNRRVAGVVSGANDLPAGAILGNLPGSENAPPIALSGRVWVSCDASNGAILPGDLLTTSDTPGHAMKVADHARAQGAIIGKAMTRLESGRGLVLVLVSLQ